MWFSYPKEENWIPVEINRVKEIQKLNREGIKPQDLRDEAVDLKAVPVVKALDYENVVGQDSITRLDERRTSNKKKKKRTNNNRPQPSNASATIKTPEVTIKETTVKPEGQNTPKQPNQQNKNRNRNRRSNNNKPKPNE